MQMGKLRDDPHYHRYPHHQSKIQKPMNKTLRKPVKITYISSSLLVRACDASEFRSVVQQLTGKDSNDFIKGPQTPYNDNSLINREPSTRATQDGALSATTATEDGNGLSYCNRSMDSLEFDEAYFWKEVALSVLQPPCVLV